MAYCDAVHTGTATLWCRKTTLAAFYLAAYFCTTSHLGAKELNTALITALNEHPRIQAAYARQREAKANHTQAYMSLLPTIQGTVSRTRVSTNPYPGGSTTKTWENELGLNLTQPLFRGGRLYNRIRQSGSEYQISGLEAASTYQSVLLESLITYATLVRDRNILTQRRNSHQVVKQILRATRARRIAGDVTNTDVSLARSRLARSQAELAQANSGYLSSEALYRRHFGRHAPAMMRRPELPVQNIPKSKEETIKLARSFNLTLLSGRQSSKAATYALRSAYGALAPSVDLNARYTRSPYTGNLYARQDEVTVGINISIPIFSGGRNSTELIASRARKQQREYETDDLERELIARSINSFEKLSSARLQIDAFKTEVHAAKATAAGIRAEANAGQRLVSDVLEAERELINSRVSLEQGYFERLEAGFSLMQITGQLSIENLNPSHSSLSVRTSELE